MQDTGWDHALKVAIDQAAEVYKVSQRQRALERRVRAAGRRYEAASPR